jgi:hypothetical protein
MMFWLNIFAPPCMFKGAKEFNQDILEWMLLDQTTFSMRSKQIVIYKD